MNDIEDIKELINDYRNSIKDKLDDNDLKEVDTFINETIKDLNKIFNLIGNVKSNKKVLHELKTSLDNHIREEKWLEKLLKTS